MRFFCAVFVAFFATTTLVGAEEIAIIKGGHLQVYDLVEASFIDSVGRITIPASRKSTSPITIRQYDLSDYPASISLLSITGGFKPDLIYAIGTTALTFAQKADIAPVVYVLVPNPAPHDDSSFFQTGIELAAPPEEWVKATLENLPGRKRVGLLLSTKSPERIESELRSMLSRNGLVLEISKVEGPQKVRLALQSLLGKVDVIWLMPDPLVLSSEAVEDVMLFGVENSLPVVSFSQKYLRSGAAVSVEPDLASVGTQAALLAINVLLHGHQPDHRTERPSKVAIGTNPAILKNLGIISPNFPGLDMGKVK